MSATFAPGAAPSFVANDLYSFALRQPNASANVQTPSPSAWRWDGAAATLDVDMGAATSIDTLAVALHSLPAGSALSVAGGSAVGLSDVFAAISLSVHAGNIAKLFDVAVAPRWLRFSVSAATGGSIGWIYAGLAFATSTMAGFETHGHRTDARLDRLVPIRSKWVSSRSS